MSGKPLWLCEDCGGPAVWTFIDGHPYYHCEQQCEGFMQMELFSRDGVEQIMKGDGPAGPAASSDVDQVKNNELSELPF